MVQAQPAQRFQLGGFAGQSAPAQNGFAFAFGSSGGAPAGPASSASPMLEDEPVLTSSALKASWLSHLCMRCLAAAALPADRSQSMDQGQGLTATPAHAVTALAAGGPGWASFASPSLAPFTFATGGPASGSAPLQQPAPGFPLQQQQQPAAGPGGTAANPFGGLSPPAFGMGGGTPMFGETQLVPCPCMPWYYYCLQSESETTIYHCLQRQHLAPLRQLAAAMQGCCMAPCAAGAPAEAPSWLAAMHRDCDVC